MSPGRAEHTPFSTCASWPCRFTTRHWSPRPPQYGPRPHSSPPQVCVEKVQEMHMRKYRLALSRACVVGGVCGPCPTVAFPHENIGPAPCVQRLPSISHLLVNLRALRTLGSPSHAHTHTRIFFTAAAMIRDPAAASQVAIQAMATLGSLAALCSDNAAPQVWTACGYVPLGLFASTFAP